MEWVADDGIIGCIDGHAGEEFGLAWQDRRECCIDVEPSLAQGADRTQAVGDRFATRLEDFADAVVVCRKREADAQVGMFGDGLQQMDVAQDVSGPGLEDEGLGRVDVDLLKDLRHEVLAQLGRLIWVCQRGAIDDLLRPELARKQGWGVCFEGCEVAPVLPVLRLEACLDAHRRDVAVRATVGAVTGRRQRVGEAGLFEEARYGREDAPGGRLIYRKEAHA